MLAVRDRRRHYWVPRAQVHLTERDLAHLWEGQRFPPPPLTTAGRPGPAGGLPGRRGGGRAAGAAALPRWMGRGSEAYGMPPPLLRCPDRARRPRRDALWWGPRQVCLDRLGDI